jgi:hypothetical protein
MTDFGELVRSGSVPRVEGFFRADGTVRRIYYDGPQLFRFELGPHFTPDWKFDPDDLADIDWADHAILGQGQGSVCCGEGSMGADGFFARLDRHGVPVWVAFMTHSNPFQQVRVDGTVATFINNLDRSVAIDLNLPDFAA